DVGVDHPGRDGVDADAVLGELRLSPTVIDSIAPLEAAYHTYSLAPPSVAAMDEISTMAPPWPPCFLDIRRIARCTDHSAPSTLISIPCRIIAELASSSREPRPVTPQL